MRRSALLFLIIALGCGAPKPSVVMAPAPAPPEAHGVTCTDPFGKGDAWLSNGHIGIRIGRDGSGTGLPAFSLSGYERSGEERLQSESNPASVTWTLDGKPFQPQSGRPYVQRFDFKTLRLNTRYTCDLGEVDATSWMERQVRQTWRIVAARAGELKVTAPEGAEISVKLNGEEVRKDFHVKVGSVTEATLTTSPSSPAGEEVRRDEGAREQVGSGSGSGKLWTPSPGTLVPRGEVSPFRGRLGSSDNPKSKIPNPVATIEIDGPVSDQQAVNSFLAYLRMAIPADALSIPVSPTGLSADFYRGHAFWDADVWVFPALALLDPDRAKVIPNYRISMLEGAKRNYKTWIQERSEMLAAGQPKGSKVVRVTAKVEGARFVEGAAKYPWESSVSGMETMIGQFRHALHQNGAVLWGLNQAQWLGLADPAKVKDVHKAITPLWWSVFELRKDDQVSIRQVLGIDEFRLTDNDLITNILAGWTKDHMRYFDGKGDLSGVRIEPFLPKKGDIFLSYEGDEQLSYKQATAVLSIYPYQYPPAEKVAKQMMDYYAPKTSPHGPAMSEAIHATIYARMNEPDKAYAEWRKAWGDFTKDRPLLLFSEHRSRDRTYFVTGAAGCLQSVLYGFLGFRIDYSPEPGAKWSKQLRGGGWLSIKPHLPKEWKRVVVRNFTVLGQRYTATITSDNVKVTQGDP